MEIAEEHKDSYLIYNRKSTNDAMSQQNSLGYQRTLNLEFAKRNNLKIASLSIEGFCKNGIIDESHSAFKEGDDFIWKDGLAQFRVIRPKFLQLVGLLKEQKIKGVIFLCLDRASRNPHDDLLLKKLEELGSDIHFSNTTYDKSSSGKMHRRLDGVMANFYSETISEKVRMGQAKLRGEGKVIYNAPLGYLNHGSGSKPFDPERAPLVKQIFEQYATGEWSFVGLAKWAQEHGLTKRPTRHRRNKEEMRSDVDPASFPKISRPVDHKTIEAILHNPFYIGKVKVDGGLKDSTAHSALIDTGLFYKVQQVLKGKTKTLRYMDKPFFTYRGLLRCPCGRSYSPYNKSGYTYYRSRCKAGCANPNPNISEIDVHAAIQDVLDCIAFTDAELLDIQAQAKTELDGISKARDKKLSDLHLKQRGIVANIEYLTKERITLLRTEAMTPETLRGEETRLNASLAAIHDEIRAYGESAQEMLQYVITFSELVKNASAYFKHALDNEKQEIAISVFTEIVINNKFVETYRAKDGFDALLRRKFPMGGGGRIRTFGPVSRTTT